MGVQGFQEYLEKRCPGAAVPVDLLKLARTAARQPPHHHHPHHHPHHPGPMPPPPPPARILIDADSSLQRLYGGYQTDWVCGGEWNAMLGYLAALSQACLYQGGLELVVVFNGTLGKERWPEWARRAQGQRQTAQLIVNHVGSKATPPPRAWFLPPACLSHCVRLAMFRFRVRVVQTLEDHHQEVLSLYRDYGFSGLIAQDSEFALCNVPAYFSSHALKLSWNGKNLTTHQYLLSEAARQLGLKTQHLPLFATLLGEERHALASSVQAQIKHHVRAHQLVLPPCEVVIKAVSEYVSSIKDLGNLDTIARDVFKQSQGFTGLSPSLVITECPIRTWLRPSFSPPSAAAPGLQRLTDGQDGLRRLVGPMETNLMTATLSKFALRVFQMDQKAFSVWSLDSQTLLCCCLPSHLTDKSSRWEDPAGRGGPASGDGSHGNGSGPNIPSLLSMATRSHMDITTPPLPQVRADISGWEALGLISNELLLSSLDSARLARALVFFSTSAPSRFRSVPRFFV
ncbi:hypothetical protein GOODEAATRI_013570 [Goodea atripinnis]|uniref:Constitutive coactivator of PPAR-gamma-like protein 2 n=1 Tax=Goodea atripinnis TaxID=208336 RepID=A0ABV0NJY0_9TELE